MRPLSPIRRAYAVLLAGALPTLVLIDCSGENGREEGAVDAAVDGAEPDASFVDTLFGQPTVDGQGSEATTSGSDDSGVDALSSASDASDATADGPPADGPGSDATDSATDVAGDSSFDAGGPDAEPPDAGHDAGLCGTDCTPAESCTQETYLCDGGVPVCTPTSNEPNGTVCGSDRVCNDGYCFVCVPGSACTPVNSCDIGTVSCTSGPVCQDTGNVLTCSTGTVCSASSDCADIWAEWPMPNDPADSPPAPNLQQYTDNGDGTVTDDVTGLMWQQSAPDLLWWGPVGTAGTAQYYCAHLTLGGHTDWRLPSFVELVSLVDWTANPAINSTYFPGTPLSAQPYWTSTPIASSTTTPFVWSVCLDLQYCGSLVEGSSTGQDGLDNFTRCVR